MPLITLETRISAPIDRCFDLARSVEAHISSTGTSRERVVGGVMSGLIGLGNEVTWEATHFGVRQRLTARITLLEKPHRFVDEMVRGAFRGFTHVHEFREEGSETVMLDRFDYTSPLGPLGRLADWLFLERYMRAFLVERAAYLKQAAESAHRQTTTARQGNGR